jgi:hypothetical protein
MTETTIETAAQRWARNMAAQIRMIQASWSDDEAAARKETIRVTLRKELDSIRSPGERRGRLEALRARFPAGVESVRVVEKAVDRFIGRVVEKAGPQPELAPEELVARLALLCPTMRQDRKEAVSRELRRAGYGVEAERPQPAKDPAGIREKPETEAPPRTNDRGDDPLPPRIKEVLEIKEDRWVSRARVWGLVELLLLSYLSLDRKAIKARDHIRSRTGAGRVGRGLDIARMRDGDRLARVVREFLSDSESAGAQPPETSAKDLTAAIEKAEGLIVLFVLGVPGDLPRRLALRLEGILGPENVRGEGEKIWETMPVGARMLATKHKVYWDAYRELWDTKGFQARRTEQDLRSSEFWGQTFAQEVMDILSGAPSPP